MIVAIETVGQLFDLALLLYPDRKGPVRAATLDTHESAGATGVIVAWDPRLIDLLRNPEADDRGDLLMSTG